MTTRKLHDAAMEEPLVDLIDRLETVPFAHEVRMDGETFRSILQHLKQALAALEQD